jgi:NADPH:quinone reductase-like Zn-dependent oxidoreductase
MKAVVCTAYGPPDVLQLAEVKKPAPKPKEVCIRIFATAVTASDCLVRGFTLPRWHPRGLLMGLLLGFGRPRQAILGMVFAGEIDSVGTEARRFSKGTRVYGSTVKSLTQIRFGAYAEYTCVSENGLLAPMPSTVTFEEAAALPYGAGMALYFLKKGRLHSGQRVLIYGASGAIGTAAVQLARHFGARVTGVCSTTNLALVQSLGAQTVLDYTREASPRKGELYDLIFDAVGRRKSSPFKVACKSALTPNGKYNSVDDGVPRYALEDLVGLKEPLEARRMRAVIDKCYPLDRIVEAHRYVDQGHKKGNVVITVAAGPPLSWLSPRRAARPSALSPSSPSCH